MFKSIFRSGTKQVSGLLVSAGIGVSLINSTGYAELEKPQEKKFTRNQVAQRDGTAGKEIWVTYKDGVYDVTRFASEHPGAGFIRKAAGSDVEPFWNVWAYHYSSPKLKGFLEKTRIGSLSDYDSSDEAEAHDPYEDEPLRKESLHTIFERKPFNTETLPSVLNESYLTPVDALYIRNHAPVPEIEDSADHEVVFSLDDETKEKSISVKKLLDSFRNVSVVSIIQCAGNRASKDAEMNGTNGFAGTIFEKIQDGMVGNILWEGVRLSSVLKEVFPNECAEEEIADKEKWHVVFEGEDEYYTSVPLEYILNPSNDCILATKMNGEPLSRDHGFPVRALLPGNAGARSVKWLNSIKLAREACDSPWNINYYRKSDGSHIQRLPMQSIILSPENGCSKSFDEDIVVEGVTYSADSPITRVEISLNNGKSWHKAILRTNEVIKDDAIGPYHGWTRFHATVKKEELQGLQSVKIASRAVDSNGNVQPEKSEQHRGYLFNGWSQVQIGNSA
eukprot:CAMPEP_0184024506 /NCGR_PEP_ID=MMETSP0954-20121128/12133_1 /TAXON_ID=627963 /ORGANISM="Aplanochytrium sp, Strain PBS07" /LENGTH=504 /DNA_ID=CAMNT_0026307867 /DNA_START=126 /DNA_END=1640 /DNA_ORIENTATION=+